MYDYTPLTVTDLLCLALLLFGTITVLGMVLEFLLRLARKPTRPPAYRIVLRCPDPSLHFPTADTDKD